MKIASAEFYKSTDIQDKEVFFDEKKEIIFIGRSNVGKSSLMNALFGTKGLVHTSSTPGKTRRANIFLINNKYYFTDLPGYGFAKRGAEEMEKIDGLISWYLEERKTYIKQVVLIVDSKIGPQKSDIDMFHFLEELGLPKVILLSKIDRLSGNDIQNSIAHTESLIFGQKVLPISTTRNIGIRELSVYLGGTLK